MKTGGTWTARLVGAGCALMLLCVPALSQSKPTSKTSATTHKAGSTSHKSKHSKKTAGNWRKRGQQKIDPQRARAIQEALIREHYLEGQPTGTWDQASQKAMEKYQADNGWQSKMIPDSRALIKLGLGPDQQHLLNPESAMTSPPPAHSATPPRPTDPPAGHPQK